jgi:spoIIIJ-associated protein
MEWVETTGRTVADAVETALDQLGVDEDELEFEVIQEPRSGFLGRLGATEARIRARIKPLSREKPGERRRRQGRRSGGGSNGGGSGRSQGAGRGRSNGDASPSPEAGTGADRSRRRRSSGGQEPGARKSGVEAAPRAERAPAPAREQKERPVSDGGRSVEEQAEAARLFTQGLVDQFGLAGSVRVQADAEAIQVDVEGDGLGLLVGPKGVTLRAIEDLVRSAVQRRGDGPGPRLNVDVAGYQARRRAALEEFARSLAARVLESGRDQALEPMPAADRKLVHDVVAEIDGVTTTSEGEEPRRRVVLRRG